MYVTFGDVIRGEQILYICYYPLKSSFFLLEYLFYGYFLLRVL